MRYQFVDCRWELGKPERGRELYLASHIPGASFLDVEGALSRVGRVPDDRISVLESGISTRANVDAALEAGASAILVGEALMRADDPARAVRKLLWRELRT